MKIFKSKKILTAVSGLTIGAVNGLMGAGGGMIAVPLLKKCGMEQKSAHTNAVAVILPICVLSAGLYLKNGYVSIGDALPYVPTGITGLKRVFALFMIYAGIRLLLK